MYDAHVIRDFEDADLPALSRIHQEMNLGVKFPDLSSPLFLVKKVSEVDGQVTGALFLRISCETILLCSGTPQDKMAAIEGLQPPALADAYAKGIDDVHAVVFPDIAKQFRKRLKQMGWTQDREHELWSRRTR